MSGKRKFIFNGLILTLVGFAMRGVTLFLGAYISGAIGAEGVGLQGLISTAYAFAVTFATSGVGLSVTRLVAASIGEGNDGERILRGAFIYALLFGSIATLILYFSAGVIGAKILSDARVIGAVRLLSFSLLPIALSSVISGYFVAVRRVTLNAAVQVFGQLMRIALTVILLVRCSGEGIEKAIEALALGVTVTELACFILALVEYVFDRRMYGSVGNKGYAVKTVAGMALPLAFSQYVRSFLLSVEHSLIPKRLVDRGNTQSEALSSYGYLSGMALPIILFPMTPLSSFSGLLVPEFAECEGSGNTERMTRIASRAVSLTLCYAIATAVFIFAFSEEIGYAVYDTYAAGRYVAFLSPVIPIMYLDHVTDSMLKGIGEQVFSMWVNIADALISVGLVFILIPIFDIEGYAIVIILMELFNFTLSFLRLKKRVSFSISPALSIVVPLGAALASVYVANRTFTFSGAASPLVWLVMKIVFTLCIYLCVTILAFSVFNSRKSKRIITKT